MRDPHLPRNLAVRLGRRLWSSPWLVLGYMAFVSGANGVAARLAAGQMPPLLLVFLRWAIVCATLSVLLSPDQKRELADLVRRHWVRLAWMGGLGYAGFNALFYVAAYHTSAVNLTLLQSAIPALVLVGAAIVFHIRIRLMQMLGLVLTAVGVVIVATGGDLALLSELRLGIGDAFVLIACAFYACYTLGLRVRPEGTPLVFFAGVAGASLLWSIPMAVGEAVAGHMYRPTLEGWVVTLLIAYGPSFTGQLCWMRGVDLIGPSRAGLFANLIPIFGTLCAVVVLHETFSFADAAALLLGLGGISLAEWPGPRRAVPSPSPRRDPPSAHRAG